MTQFPDPSAVMEFREDAAIRYFPPGQVSCQARLQDICNSVRWVMWRGGDSKIAKFIVLVKMLKTEKQCGVHCRSFLGSRPAAGTYVEMGIQPTTSNQQKSHPKCSLAASFESH